jgi:hypothetical protein
VDALKVLLHAARIQIASKTLDLTKHAALDRAATTLQRKIIDTTVPRDRCRRRARCRARFGA